MESESARRWKEIMSEWNEEFQFLKPYGSMRLFYRTDILMLGLFLEKLIWQSYRVGFEVKQLWLPPTDNDYNCIYTPILNHRTKSDRCTYRIKYGIDRDNHDFYFRRALESTRIRYGDVFNGTVSSGFLIELNDRMNTPRLKHDFYAESQYYEFQIAMAVYFQEYDRLEKIYAELDKECSYWSRKLKRGRRIYGLTQSSDISSWRKNIESTISDRNKLLAICEENSKIKKIRRLNKGELIYTPYVKEDNNKLWSGIVSSVKKLFP